MAVWTMIIKGRPTLVTDINRNYLYKTGGGVRPEYISPHILKRWAMKHKRYMKTSLRRRKEREAYILSKPIDKYVPRGTKSRPLKK